MGVGFGLVGLGLARSDHSHTLEFSKLFNNGVARKSLEVATSSSRVGCYLARGSKPLWYRRSSFSNRRVVVFMPHKVSKRFKKPLKQNHHMGVKTIP